MKRKNNLKRTSLGSGLLKGLKEAVEFESGKIHLRTTTLEIPDAPPTFKKKTKKHSSSF